MATIIANVDCNSQQRAPICPQVEGQIIIVAEGRPPFSFDFIPPPPDLARYVNSLYKLTYHRAIDDVLPAYSAQLMVSSGPGGFADFGKGLTESYRNCSLLGPMTSAHRVVMPQPTEIYGVSISIYGWAAMTGLPALASSNCHVDAVTGLGQEAGEAALALGRNSAELSDGEVFAALTDIIRSRATPLNEGHGKVIETTHQWLLSDLSPSIDDLYAQLPYSQRQAQRLVRQFFGLPPARLKRQYRALRAAIILSDPNVTEAARDKVFAAFYDQAHLIRELRQFTGSTPRWLEPGRVTLASTTMKAEHRGGPDELDEAAE